MRSLSLLALLAAAPALAQEFPVTVSDGEGRDVTVAAPPAAIVCLPRACIHTLAVFDVLPLAASGDNIAAAADPAVFGDRADGITELFWVDGYDIEAILGMAPDLVVTWIGAEEWVPVDSLRQSVPVYVAPNYDSTEDFSVFEADVRAFGTMLGRQDDAEAFITGFHRRLDAYDRLSEPDTSVLVVRIPPPSEATQEAWVVPSCGPAIERLADCSLTTGNWVQTTTEGLLSLDPDVLIVEDWNEGHDPANLGANMGPLWAELSAVKEGRVHLLSPSVTIDYSLLSMANSLDALMPLLYPETFPAPLSEAEVAAALAQ